MIKNYKVRKVNIKVPKKQLLEDCERYRLLSLELGATDSKVIPADQIIIDERALMKCIYPKCKYYGTNAHCPPHAVTPQQMARIVSSYRYAIFYTIKGSSECDEKIGDKEFPENVSKLRFEITSRIESETFYDGYYFAMGFVGSSCKKYFCPKKDCAVLQNKSCRAPLIARSSMEAVGMDVFKMATRVGWDIYPIGKSISFKDVPFGRGLGLILID